MLMYNQEGNIIVDRIACELEVKTYCINNDYWPLDPPDEYFLNLHSNNDFAYDDCFVDKLGYKLYHSKFPTTIYKFSRRLIWNK